MRDLTLTPEFVTRPRRPRCFSLIELLVVICILAILAGMAVPRYAASVQRQRLEGAGRRVEQDLRLARERALQTSTAQRVQFFTGTHACRLLGYADPEHPTRDYETCFANAPYEVQIDSADFGGNAELIYDGYGRPDSGGSLVLRAGDSILTIWVAAEVGTITRSAVATAPSAAAAGS